MFVSMHSDYLNFSRRLSRSRNYNQSIDLGQWRWFLMVVALTVLVSCSTPPSELSEDSVSTAQTPTPVVSGSPIEENRQLSPAPQFSKAKTTDQLADELHQVLRDTTQDINSRRQAAVKMLALGDVRANDTLIQELTLDTDQVTQQLVVQAILAMDQKPPSIFIKPLLGLVTRAQEPLLYDVAQVLSRFKGRRHVRRLIALALDRSTHVRRRRGAIIALGYYRDRDVAGKLVRLIQTHEPPTIIDAAYMALAGLTGIDHFDREQWKVWWDQHRHLSDQLWLEAIANSLADRNNRLVARHEGVEDRLVEAQRHLYRATPQGDRSAMLVTMLNDPLVSVRQLAIDLCVQRLTDTEPIGPELRAALLIRLDDRSSTNRQRAALLLRDLGDEAAAEVVAQRLMSGTEKTRKYYEHTC